MSYSIGDNRNHARRSMALERRAYTWQARYGSSRSRCEGSISPCLTLQLPFPQVSESMGKTSLHGWHRQRFLCDARLRHDGGNSPSRQSIAAKETRRRGMTIGYRPLWDGRSPIRVRRAEPGEEVYYINAKAENAACLWSIWFSATMKRIHLVPSLVDHFPER